jgi:hypothetical protein
MLSLPLCRILEKHGREIWAYISFKNTTENILDTVDQEPNLILRAVTQPSPLYFYFFEFNLLNDAVLISAFFNQFHIENAFENNC